MDNLAKNSVDNEGLAGHCDLHGKAWPGLRVLCVDDNQDLANSTVLLLQLVGFEARACYDGRTALQVAETFHPSVCILDLQMPGMDGDELATRLREQSERATQFIAVTAMSDEESRERTSAAGFDMHLVKPVDPTELMELVDALFRPGSIPGNKSGVPDGSGWHFLNCLFPPNWWF